MAVTEFRKDFERPVDTRKLKGFKRCWKCSGRELVEPATKEQIAYLGVPPGTYLDLDCALLVPEDFVLTPEMEEEIARRGAVVNWDTDEEKFVPVDKDETISFNQNQRKWDAEEYGVWK